MAGFQKKFESHNQSHETPDDMFKRLNNIFQFTCDVCASSNNTKCSKYYTEEDSCLTKTWSGVNWMNPPFKNMKNFIVKAYEERERAITVCLIPARTNTNWWHDYCMKGEVWFIRGRPKFGNMSHGLPQPLALVIFGTGTPGHMSSFNLNPKKTDMNYLRFKNGLS